MKLASQFKGGAGGGERLSDTVGAGSKDWDPRMQALVTPELRSRAKRSVMDMLTKPGTMTTSVSSSSMATVVKPSGDDDDRNDFTTEEKPTVHRRNEDETQQMKNLQSRGIFDGVVVYINGSTHPLISDHKLKHVLSEHGGKTSIHLGRRQVTHVILGRPAGGTGGAGGGLAGGKLQREIQKVGGRGVKFVGVEWVLDSIKAGKRLPEPKFSNLKVASKGQQSVFGLYSNHRVSGEQKEA